MFYCFNMFVLAQVCVVFVLKNDRLLDFLFLFRFLFWFLGLSFWACMCAHALCMHMPTRSVFTHTVRMHMHTHTQKSRFTSLWFYLLSTTCVVSISLFFIFSSLCSYALTCFALSIVQILIRVFLVECHEHAYELEHTLIHKC